METELRNIIRTNEEKLIQIQTYAKNYIEKLLENHDNLSQSLVKFSNDAQTRVGHLESGSHKLEKYIAEISDKLYQTVSKNEMDLFIKRIE